jgi:hypothetical protein
MSSRRFGIAALAAIAFALLLEAGAPFAMKLSRAHGCSCPLKGPCCTAKVCTMADAPHATASMRACGDRSAPAPMPGSRRRMALAPADDTALMPASRTTHPAATDAATASGFVHAPDRPPRVSFLVIV